MFDFFPSILTVDAARHGPLTNWLMYGYFGVMPRVRDIIEELEPNLHQFIPLRVVYKHGNSTSIHPYYTLKINRCASVWDESHMQFETRTVVRGLPPVPVRVIGTPIAFKRSAIEGMHVWRQLKPEGHHFISSTLKMRLESEGLLHGLDLTPCFLTD